MEGCYLDRKYLHYNDQPIQCDKSQQRWHIEQKEKKKEKEKEELLIRKNIKVNDFEQQIKLVPLFFIGKKKSFI